MAFTSSTLSLEITRHVATLWTMISSLKSNDLKEAMQAFMEKRAPEFSGS